MIDLSLVEERKKLLEFVDLAKNTNEDERVKASIKECEVYSGKIKTHLKKYLLERYSPETVNEMPLVSCVNMAKRIANQEASLYKETPKRTFQGLDEESETYTKVKDLYTDSKVTDKLLRLNRLYRLQMQNALYIKVERGAFKPVPLKLHQYFVYQDEEEIYIIPNHLSVVDSMTDEEKKKKMRFTVWCESYNFVMDGEGSLIGDTDVSNPIGILPIIDVAGEKDTSFWVEDKRELAEFTIQFNAALCDLWHVMNMQGFAIGAISGPAEILEKLEQQTIGLNKLIKLPTMQGRDGNVIESDLKFVSPSPDLTGSIKVIETILSAFLSSEGMDPSTVSITSNSEKFASGWERLLALIQKFDSTKEDVSIFKEVEKKVWDIFKAYIKTYREDTKNILDEKYRIQGLDDVTLSVEYNRPEMVETQAEKEDRAFLQEEKGASSVIDTIMVVHNLNDREAAKKKAKEIKEENEAYKVKAVPTSSVDEDEDEEE